MTEIELRRMVTDMANHYCQIGTYEWNPTLMKLIEIYNAHEPLTRNVKYKPEIGGWCGLFVSVMFILNGMADLIVTEVGAYEWMKNAKERNEWQPRGAYIPKPGDVVVYAYQQTKDGKPYTQYHVGIVTNADAKVVYTTEGNVQDRVMMMAHQPDDKTILGYWAVPYQKLVVPEPEIPVVPSKTGTYTLKAVRSSGGVRYEWRKDS